MRINEKHLRFWLSTASSVSGHGRPERIGWRRRERTVHEASLVPPAHPLAWGQLSSKPSRICNSGSRLYEVLAMLAEGSSSVRASAGHRGVVGRVLGPPAGCWSGIGCSTVADCMTPRLAACVRGRLHPTSVLNWRRLLRASLVLCSMTLPVMPPVTLVAVPIPAEPPSMQHAHDYI